LHNDLTFAYDEVDDQGSAFLYNVRFTGYKETQRTLAVTIPLLLQYHTDGAAAQWYINGGGKLFLPVNTSIRVSAQQMSLSGYYPNYDLVIADLSQHGFGTAGDWKSNATTQLKPSAALSAGTGFSVGISPGTRLYAGVYIDYGLTGLKSKGDSMPMVSYSPTGIDGVKANSVLNTQNAGEPKLLSFGVQLRLTWGAGPAKHPAHSEKKPVSIPTIVTTGALLSDSELIAIQRPIVFGIVGETDIPETQTPLLDDVVTIMQRHPDIRISITGYTCDGTQQMEDAKLGDARAKAVARYLERKGIDRRRMELNYEKQSEPSKSYDPAANFRNRKVLISPE
jgi:outer membrane protein OmpA-like peptidoglycan-associated protein